LCLLLFFLVPSMLAADSDYSNQYFSIEGKVSVVNDKQKLSDWMGDTTVQVNGGDYKGFLKSDGSFVIHAVPSGSHIVEVASANYEFERYRVDITKGGKIRARRVNFVQPSAVQVVPYPLRFITSKQAEFFEKREQWKVTDVLMNPMVLMMLLPIIFVVIMPKLMSMADPEAQKEMQAQMSMFNTQSKMPDAGELASSLFGGSDGKRKKITGAIADKGVVKKAGKRR